MNKRVIQFDAYIPALGLILNNAAISLGMAQLIVSLEEIQELVKGKFKFDEDEGIVYSLVPEEDEEGKYENIMEFLVGEDWFLLEEEKCHILQHTGAFYSQEPQRPIVEGDIVKYFNSKVGVITYDPERIMFLLKSKDGTLVDFAIRTTLLKLEYLGNEFLNPELLA